MDTQPRQPSGTPTGGQYAATTRTEPAVDLSPDVTPAQAEATTASAVLAQALDVDPQTITVQFHSGANEPVSLTAFGPVDAVTGEQVFVRVHQHETGHETHLRVDVRYPVNLQGLPWDTDTAAAYLRGVLPTTTGNLHHLIDEALDQARIASALDRLVNAHVFEQNQRATVPDDWFTLPRVTVKEAGSQPVLHLELNGDPEKSVDLEVRRDDGVVTAAALWTAFGPVRLTDDEHLDTVLASVDRELARTPENPAGTGTRDGLNTRLRAVFRHVDR